MGGREQSFPPSLFLLHASPVCHGLALIRKPELPLAPPRCRYMSLCSVRSCPDVFRLSSPLVLSLVLSLLIFNSSSSSPFSLLASHQPQKRREDKRERAPSSRTCTGCNSAPSRPGRHCPFPHETVATFPFSPPPPPPPVFLSSPK